MDLTKLLLDLALAVLIAGGLLFYPMKKANDKAFADNQTARTLGDEIVLLTTGILAFAIFMFIQGYRVSREQDIHIKAVTQKMTTLKEDYPARKYYVYVKNMDGQKEYLFYDKEHEAFILAPKNLASPLSKADAIKLAKQVRGSYE